MKKGQRWEVNQLLFTDDTISSIAYTEENYEFGKECPKNKMKIDMARNKVMRCKDGGGIRGMSISLDIGSKKQNFVNWMGLKSLSLVGMTEALQQWTIWLQGEKLWCQECECYIFLGDERITQHIFCRDLHLIWFNCVCINRIVCSCDEQ